MKFVKDKLCTFSILAIHERIFYSKNIILLPLTDVADVMLTQSDEKVNHVRSKGRVGVKAYVMLWAVVCFKVDAFRKEYFRRRRYTRAQTIFNRISFSVPVNHILKVPPTNCERHCTTVSFTLIHLTDHFSVYVSPPTDNVFGFLLSLSGHFDKAANIAFINSVD